MAASCAIPFWASLVNPDEPDKDSDNSYRIAILVQDENESKVKIALATGIAPTFSFGSEQKAARGNSIVVAFNTRGAAVLAEQKAKVEKLCVGPVPTAECNALREAYHRDLNKGAALRVMK